jgi:hypothetical protein
VERGSTTSIVVGCRSNVIGRHGHAKLPTEHHCHIVPEPAARQADEIDQRTRCSGEVLAARPAQALTAELLAHNTTWRIRGARALRSREVGSRIGSTRVLARGRALEQRLGARALWRDAMRGACIALARCEETMKTLSRIILGLALTAPLAVTSAVRADDKTPPAHQKSPDKTSADKTSADKTSPDKTPPDKTSAGDRKQDVTIDQLPKVVKATVQRETKGKQIASITKSTDSSGAAAYDIKVLDGDKETTIGVANDGKVTARKTGVARGSSSSTPPGANPTDANPPRVNSPHATAPSSPPSSSRLPSSPPASPSPPLANSPSATSPSSPPRATDTPSNDKKQEQRPNPPRR